MTEGQEGGGIFRLLVWPHLSGRLGSVVWHCGGLWCPHLCVTHLGNDGEIFFVCGARRCVRAGLQDEWIVWVLCCAVLCCLVLSCAVFGFVYHNEC